MFSQYFGHYLLNSGLITAEQLKEAFEKQGTTHVKIGVMAVDEGYMTASQVEEVHEKQRQMDKRFGEIAVELGYLTDEQVNQMLSAQKQDHLILAQALVDQGFMTIEQYSSALSDYKVKHSLTDDKFEAIKSGDIEALVENSINIMDLGNKDYIIQYISLFAKNLIRFIDNQVYLEVHGLDQPFNYDWVVHQDIVGEKTLYTAIAANEEVFLEIASAYAEEQLTEIDELAKASVSEFLNLHNGIFLVNMSNQGCELEMKPQQVTHHSEIQGEATSYILKVQTTKGTFSLLLSQNLEKIHIHSIDDSQAFA